MLPDSGCNTVGSTIAGLRKHFKPAHIEELGGLEFHHLTKGSQLIEQLGLNIQHLGHKAFPTIVGKDFE